MSLFQTVALPFFCMRSASVYLCAYTNGLCGDDMPCFTSERERGREKEREKSAREREREREREL